MIAETPEATTWSLGTDGAMSSALYNYTTVVEKSLDQLEFYRSRFVPFFANQTTSLLANGAEFRPLIRINHSDFIERNSDLNMNLKVVLYIVYACIFLIGILGNVLVCYVIFRQSTMHSVTNIYIANLALADILLCLFAVPFTPLYLLAFKEWIFGSMLCHLVPFAQGMSVYISIFTLMSIAIERYMVIVHPYKQQIAITSSIVIICIIWLLAFVLTLPYGIFIDVIPIILVSLSATNTTDIESLSAGNVSKIEALKNAFKLHHIRPKYYCDEVWPNNDLRIAFGVITTLIQFVIPFCIITYCYIQVCFRLWNRVQTRPGSRNCSSQRKWLEKERARRMNMMLIFMVVIFAVSWLPLNTYNLVEDFYAQLSHWKHSRSLFMAFHAIAMSSTCYNPFLYSWLNYNFRKEFKSIFQPVYSRLQCFVSNPSQISESNKELRPNFMVGWRKHTNQPLVNTDRTDNSNTNKLQIHTTKNSTHTTRFRDETKFQTEDEGEQISFTVLDTTTNLVTNLESINEAELQESLLVTSVRNGVYANRVMTSNP